jgi:ferric-dicitrate binding protein FerR (iron transport regulator)
MVGHVEDSSVTAFADSSAGDLTAWTRGKLVFHDVRLGVVVTDLARAYGIGIRLTDSVLAQQPVTVTAQPGEHSLAQVLELITRATGAHYVRVGTGFAIEPGRTSLNMPRSRRVPGPEKIYGR